MLRSILSAFGFGWRRVGDASTVSWILPSTWGLAVSAAGGIVAGAGAALAQVPAYLWLPLAVLVALAVLVCADRFLAIRDRLRGRSRLEIHFDPTNPARRFWSLESPRDEAGNELPGLLNEYRVDVHNPTSRTVRNVAVTVESLGLTGARPISAFFDKSRGPTCDLRPGCSELAVVLHWPHPKVYPGIAWGPSAIACYGPLVVTVGADDFPPTHRQFWIDPKREPMLFDRLEPGEEERARGRLEQS